MSPVPVTLRLARLDDAAAITRIHCSHVPQWYREVDGDHCDVGYDALTLDERFGFGGPWMSVETCAVHLNNLFLSHNQAFVAEADGIPVAEMELFMGREGMPYGKTCHIGLLYVHKDHTGQGIGGMLVERAIRFAQENQCNSLTVSSAQATEAFYRKCGFSFQDALVEIEAYPGDYVAEVTLLPLPASLQSFTWGMNMRIGRLQSSAYHVFEISDRYWLPSCMNIHQYTHYLRINGHPVAISCTCPEPGNAIVRAWSSEADTGDLVFAALRKSSAMGLRSANMLLSRKDYEHVESMIDSRLIGTRRTLMMKV